MDIWGVHFEIMALQEQGGDVFKGKRHFQKKQLLLCLINREEQEL